MTKQQKLEFLKLAERDILAKSRTYHIKGMEWEDVAQELRISVWRASDKYDKKRAGERTFIHYVIQNRLRDLAKASKRKKRQIDCNHISIEAFLKKIEFVEKNY